MTEEKFYSLKEEQEASGNMIFPLNIHQSLNASAGLQNGEKITIAITGWVIFCAILAWLLMSFIRNIVPTHYILITISIIIILNLTLGVYLLRFLMDERSVLKEYEAKDGDSFASYFRIYRDTQMSIDSKYGIIEYDDGTQAAILRMRLGYNTNDKSNNTWMFNRDAFRIINDAGMPHREITTTEVFRDSDSSEFMRRQTNNINDPVLKEAQKRILKGIFDIAEKESNVPVMYIMIFATTQIMRDELYNVIKRLEKHYDVEQTCFRDIKFLNNDEILEFLRNYYKLEVMDMSLLRAKTTINDLSKSVSCELLRVYGTSGKNYNTDAMHELLPSIIKNTGIRKVK